MSVRLFISLPLPDSARNELRDVQGELRQYLSPNLVRWTRPEGLHVTLAFLGNVEDDAVESLSSAAGAAFACHTTFHLKLSGLGGFPTGANPKVLWTGLSGETERLRGLQRDVAKAVGPFMQRDDPKPFRGHVTLGRVRGEPERVGRALRSLNDQFEAEWAVREGNLMASVLGPGGSAYRALSVFPLRGLDECHERD